MSRSKWVGLIATILIVSGVVWYFVSPSYTLGQMRAAAEANDADALSGYIDYESLREDMKSEFMARMMVEAQKDQSGFGALGIALGSAMIGSIIDGMISPAGIRAMLIADQQSVGNAPKAPVKVDQNPIIERRGLSEFAVKSKSESDGAMVFKRHGLSWKLSGIELPPEL